MENNPINIRPPAVSVLPEADFFDCMYHTNEQNNPTVGMDLFFKII